MFERFAHRVPAVVPGALAMTLLTANLVAAPSGGDDRVRISDLRQQIFDSIDGDPRHSAELIEQYMQRAPQDARMIYNAACIQCRLDDLEAAERYLMQAVRGGFLDFSRMKRDPDLDPLRERRVYLALIAARDAADPILAQRCRDDWTKSLGADRYRFEPDETRRLTWATALSERSQAAVRARVERQADHLVETLFHTPLTHVVLVALPRPDDVPRVFGDGHVHGHYQHGMRRLIAADAGRALRHELVHVYHHAHMDRLGQQHPMWVQEGMACLYEAHELADDGTVAFLANDRDVQARRLDEDGRLLLWARLFRLTDSAFRTDAMYVYPQVRSMFRYLAAEGRLVAWYRRYTEHYHDDPTGGAALEHVFGRELPEIESRWRRWLRRQPVEVPPEPAAERLEWLAPGENAAGVMGPPAPELTVPQRRAAELHAEGRDSYALGRYRAAAERFREAIEADPDHADARYDLALASLRLGDQATARVQRKRLDTLEPSLASLLANLLQP